MDEYELEEEMIDLQEALDIGDKQIELMRGALESHVRGLDAMRKLISEGRGSSGKLEDIRTAIIYERVNAVAALKKVAILEGEADALEGGAGMITGPSLNRNTFAD